MLQYPPTDRPTAAQLLQHDFFKPRFKPGSDVKECYKCFEDREEIAVKRRAFNEFLARKPPRVKSPVLPD